MEHGQKRGNVLYICDLFVDCAASTDSFPVGFNEARPAKAEPGSIFAWSMFIYGGFLKWWYPKMDGL